MVLNYVTNGSSLIVKSSAALYSEVLSHGDLNALDVIAIPECFDECIGETEDQHVVHWTLAKVVVDPEDRCLAEDRVQHPVQLLRRRQVMPEGFFDNHSR